MPHMIAGEHAGQVNALIYGTARTQVTIAAAVAAIGASPRTLIWTNTGDGIWTIGSNTTVPANIVNHIPAGVTVNRGAGVTLTLQGPIISWSPSWETGPGVTSKGTSVATENSYLRSNRILVTSDTTDAIVVRGAIASGAAVRMFVEQGGGNAGISLSRTDSSNAATWQFLINAGGSLSCSRPGAGSMLHLADVGLGIGLGQVPGGLLQLLADSAFKPGAGGLWSVVSDADTKEIGEAFDLGMAALRQLPKPVRFRYNGKAGTLADGSEDVGYVAQELEQVMPNLVRRLDASIETATGTSRPLLGTNLGLLLYLHTNALKELDQRLAALEAR